MKLIELTSGDFARGFDPYAYNKFPTGSDKSMSYMCREVVKVYVELAPWKPGDLPLDEGEKAQSLLHELRKKVPNE